METDMENIQVDADPFEPDESNMKELWSPSCYTTNFCEMQVDSVVPADWQDILDNNEDIVLNDRMMTDAVQSPRIQSEHSYSLMNLTGDLMVQFGVQSEDSKDMDQECFPSVPMSTVSDQSGFPEDIPIKQEPPSPTSPSPETKPFSHLRASSPPLALSSTTAIHPNSLLKQPTVVLATRPNLSTSSKSKDTCLSSLPKVSIKLEPVVSTTAFSLPPTPPSSNSSDSDGSLSPIHASSHPPSPSASSQTTTLSGRRNQPHAKFVVSLTSSSQTQTNSSSRTSSSSLISSQPKGAVGVLTLTDEEKRTLVAEGYEIPQNLPLSKAEERSLKKIRRKIKNKISAQESRRKKKEYMDALEKKVQLLTDENCECKKKIESLEISNKSLLSQLQHLQTLLGGSSQKALKSTAIQLCNQSSDTRKHKKDDITSCLELCGVPKYAGR